MDEVAAVVLAGGEGRRLWPLTRECCKPALPFAGRHRTIDFTLSNCLHSGLANVAVLAQYAAASLSSHLERFWQVRMRRAGVSLEVCLADRARAERFRGTADAVAQYLARLDLPAHRRVLVLAGDHVYRMDYRALLADHASRKADITVACAAVPQAEAQAFGVVTVDERGRIIGFEEKPAKPAGIPGRPGWSFVSMGIYLFETEVLAACLHEEPLDFGRDVLPRCVGRSGLFAHWFRDAVQPQSSYWRDVGTIDAYWDAHMDLLSTDPPLDTRDPRWPIGELRGQHTRASLRTEMPAEARVARNAQLYRSALSPGAHVGEGAVLRECIVLPGARVGAGCRLTKVIVDHDCTVPEGLCLGEGSIALDTRSAAGVTVITAADVASAALEIPPRASRHSANAMPRGTSTGEYVSMSVR